MSEKKVNYLLLLDTHPNHYYALRRISAIKRALKDRGEYNILDLYEFVNSTDRVNLQELSFAEKHAYPASNNLEAINQQFLKVINQFDFDILLLFTIHDYKHFLLPDTVDQLRASGKVVVGALGDEEIPENFEEYKFWLPLFDRVVAYSKKETSLFNEIHDNVLRIPVATDMEKSKPREAVSREFSGDCVYLGSPNPARVAVVENLIANDIKIDVFGIKRWMRYKKVRKAYRGFPSNADYDRVLAGYGILIGLMEDGDGLVHINAKLFDAARIGMFVITSYYPPFIEDYGLVEGEDLVMYRSPDELVEKIRYYLANSDERRRIADNLSRKIRDGFDYGDLYTRLFDQLEEAYPDTSERVDVPDLITYVVEYDKNITFQAPSKAPVIYISRNTPDPTNGVYSYHHFSSHVESMVTTDYVVMTKPGIRYMESLNRYMQFLGKNFEFDRCVFRTYTDDKVFAKSPYVYDLASVVWQRDAFKTAFKRIFFFRDSLWFDFDKARTISVPLLMNHAARRYWNISISNVLTKTSDFSGKVARKIKSSFHWGR